MELKTVKLADLKPAKYNPRKALQPGDPDYEKLAASIRQNGYLDPIVVNSDLTIIGGHQRRTVMMDLGIEEAPVIVVDIPDQRDEMQANIALNAISGEWDKPALFDLLIELDQAGKDLAAAGFDSDDLSELSMQIDIQTEAKEDHFDTAKAAAEITEPETKLGDIYRLGDHRLICGDALDFDAISVLMAGAKADLVLTDPPYNVGYEAKDKRLERIRKRNRTRKNNKIDGDEIRGEEDFYNFLFRAFRNCCDVAKGGAAVYVFHADIEGLTVRQALDASGFKLKQVLIWEKNNFVIGRSDYQWRHEPILYGWKEGAPHYFIDDRKQDEIFIDDDIDFSAMKKADLVSYIERIRSELSARSTVQYEKKPMHSDLHPTMKPVSLVGRLMANSSRYGENVLDPFAGSGTTLIAAEELHRTAYLAEISPIYCDVIVKRWEDYTGRKAEKIRGGAS